MGEGVSGVEEEHVNQELEFGVTQWCEKGSTELKIHRTDTELEGMWSVAIIGKISLEEVKSKLKGKDGRVVGV